jgi:3'(2'), 5'-bisphosphate nucleotidase
MTSDFANETLLQEICKTAVSAGQAIMDVYRQGDLGVQLKADASPVTVADLAANDIIVKALSQITPTIMIISEESLKQNHAPAKRLDVQNMWFVDPLDGTKEFIKGSDEFTVNIALVRDHEPILGVVYAPALDILYAAVRGSTAWKRDANGNITTLKTFTP